MKDPPRNHVVKDWGPLADMPEEIPISIWRDKLKFFDLSDTRVYRFRGFKYQRLDDDSHLRLARAFERGFASRLEVCILSKTVILAEDKGMAICKSIRGLKNLRVLDLSETGLEEDQCIELGKAIFLSNLGKRLEKIILDNNLCRDLGILSLARGFKDNSNLVELNLVNNELGESAGKAIARILYNSHSMKILNLGNNRIGIKAGRHLGFALTHNRSLEYLDLSTNHLEDRGAMGILYAVSRHPKLSYLNLSSNRLTRRLKNLFAGVVCSAMSNLQHLDISGNDLMDSCIHILSKALRSKHSKIYELNISRTRLSKVSMESLCNAISWQGENNHSSPLIILDVSYNDGGDWCGESFGRLLSETNCKLESLNLSENKVGLRGFTRLSAGLAWNKNLRQLDLNGNPFLPSSSYKKTPVLEHILKCLNKVFESNRNLYDVKLGKLSYALEDIDQVDKNKKSYNDSQLSSFIAAFSKLDGLGNPSSRTSISRDILYKIVSMFSDVK